MKAAFRPPRKFVALDLENMTKAVNERKHPPSPLRYHVRRDASLGDYNRNSAGLDRMLSG